jgi:quercetin dioxygenase-like cupin family protein
MNMDHLALADVQWREIAAGVERGELRPIKPGAGTALLRFAKGSSTRAHRHPGGEELFVLHGRLRIGDKILGPGDYLYTPPEGVNDAEAFEDTIVFQYQPEPIVYL